MFLWTESDDRVAIVKMNAELRHAQLELLSAECATDRLRLRFSPENVARHGERDILRKAVASATALKDYYSDIARLASEANTSISPRATLIPEEKVVAAIDSMRQYIQERRKEYRTQGLPLTPNQYTKMKAFFSPALLAEQFRESGKLVTSIQRGMGRHNDGVLRNVIEAQIMLHQLRHARIRAQHVAAGHHAAGPSRAKQFGGAFSAFGAVIIAQDDNGVGLFGGFIHN